MSTAQRLASLLSRNQEYASTYTAPPPLSAIRQRAATAPGGSIVVLSCSDPRVVPAQYFKLGPGEGAIIRNAGGRAVDAVRSLVVLDALARIGTVIVVHHTDCGQTHVLDADVKHVLKGRRPELANEIDGMSFGEITDVEQSVRDDIALLKAEPLLADDINVLGYVLDLETGLLSEVKA